MSFLLTSVALCLHIMFWGIGLARLVAPRRWRRFWPVWIAPAGIFLQSLVVWAGAHTAIPGTDAYAWWSELIPLGLLVVCVRRNGRDLLRDLAKFSILWVVMAGCLVLLALPFSRASKDLTTVSMGSCDAADYAAGARVFKEFSSTDRTGFMGQTDVVSVGSTDNFFDFWVRLNHFTPSALIALNASVFALEPWQITSLVTALLVVLMQPLVFWLGRTVFGFGQRAGLWLALIYGIGPVPWYAVGHVATAQFLAAAGIAIVTWCGVMLWRERYSPGVGWSYAGVLGIGGAILWGGYNFIVIVCFVPAIAYAGGVAIVTEETKQFLRWLARMLVPFALAGAVFYERVAGLLERFILFRQFDFGWKINALGPEGWFGVVGGAGLEPIAKPWAIIAAMLVIAALIAGWRQIYRVLPRRAWLYPAFLVPVLLGYFYLQWRGMTLNTNASYDAYKLFAVFHVVLLGALCPWLRWLRGAALYRWTAVALIALVTLGNVRAMSFFSERIAAAPLIVEPDLPSLQAVEELERVHSINMRVSDFWARLWANSFLLRKEQYFLTHTYEGRLNTPMRGEWDLGGDLIGVKLPAEDYVEISERFSLTRVESPYGIVADWGAGWYDIETLSGAEDSWWRWGGDKAAFELENPHDRPLRVVLYLKARSLSERDLQFWVGDAPLAETRVGVDLSDVTSGPMVLPPGRATVELRSKTPATRASESDTRLLGVAVYGVTIEVLGDEPPG